jgi:SAM-dependent methyltransferase
MDRIPEDPIAREEWLRTWAAEREGRMQPPRRLHQRLWRPVATKIELQVERAQWYLDRGLDTGGHLYDAPEIADVDGVVYMPTPWHVLPRALRAVRASEADAFVDFGCGKGRIVHQAAKRPLRRVIGVEISPELAAFARRLAAAHRHEYRCRNVEIIVGDAAHFAVPDDVTIGFMFDPFRGQTLNAVLRNLIASIDRHPRRVHLIYVNPRQGDQFLATGRFQLLTWLRGGLRDVRINRAAIFQSCG